MPGYSRDLIRRMRAALDEAMTEIPAEHATAEVKAHMAEIILKAAAAGQTNYEALLAVASEKIQTVLSQAMPRASIPPTRRQ